MNKKISLAALLACATLSANATFYPISLTGFNQDIVANGVGSANTSTTLAVDAADYNFVAADFKAVSGNTAPAAALPTNGLINSAATANVQYQLADYSGNNSLLLNASTTTGSLTFGTSHTGDLYILGTSGSGDADATFTVNFSDNTTQVFSGVNFPDWYGGSGYAIQSIGRVNRVNDLLENPTGDPRLYERKLTLSPSNYQKQIISVDVTKTGGKGILNIMAITVCQVPVINTQPVAKNICETENTTFSTDADETNSYRWQVDDGSGFTDINNNSVYTGAFTSSLTLANVPAAFNNNVYRCKLMSACGATVYTSSSTINVTPAVFITSQPERDTSCVRGSASIAITNAGNAVNYKWQMGSTSNGFVDVPNEYPYSGINTSQLNIAYTEDTLDGKIFRCIVDGTCNTATSNAINFVVLPSPFFASNPTDVKVRALDRATFTVAAAGRNYNMYWQASTDGINFVNINDNAIYSGTKTKTLTIKSVLPAYDGDMFRCILKSNETACSSVRDTSDIAQLTIDIPTSVSEVKSPQHIHIYPNPVKDILKFESSSTFNHVNIYDMNGRLILSQNIMTNAVSVTELPAGVYAAVFFRDDGLTERKQFVKQ